MAIVWGGWTSGYSNNFRVGIDLWVSGTTINAAYYVEAQYVAADDQTLHRTGAITGNISFRYDQSGGQRHIGTYTRSGTRGQTYTFGASISGIYNGASPSVSGVSITVPALAPSKPVRPTISAVTASSLRVNLSSAPANNGAAISRYEWQLDGGSVVNGNTNRHYDFGSLSANTAYRGRVRARNSAGVSAWSDWSAYSTTNPLAPNTPSAPSVTRVSDTSHTLAFTVPGAAARPVTQWTLERSSWNGTAWSAWVNVGQGSGTWTANTARTHSDTSTAPNSIYRWRVVVSNAAGSANSSPSVTVRTTPAAPAIGSAVKSGANITVTGTPNHPGGNGTVTYLLYDSPGGAPETQVASGVALPLTHTAPNPSVTHRYTLRAQWSNGLSATLTSAASGQSNTVQLQAPPNAPLLQAPENIGWGDLVPAGMVVRGWVAVLLPFVHQPVDTTAQTQAQVRWRVNGGAWTTQTLTTQTFLQIATPDVAGTVEWQARTRGDHVTYSDWSAIRSETLVTPPTVTMTGPTGTIPTSTVTATWAYFSADGTPQGGAELTLFRLPESTPLETLNVAGAATTATFNTRAEDGGTYGVTIQVRTAQMLRSTATSTAFTADYPPVQAATVALDFDRATGANTISIDLDDTDPLAIPPDEVDVEWFNRDTGQWVTLVSGMDPATSMTHALPYLDVNEYRVVARDTSLPAENLGPVVEQIVGELYRFYVNSGDDLTDVAVMVADPKVAQTPVRDHEMIRPAGARWPVAIYGQAVGNTLDVSWAVVPRGHGWDETALVATWKQLAWDATPVAYRDPEGRRIIGVLRSVGLGEDGPNVKTVAIQIEQTED